MPEDVRASPERRGRQAGTALWAFGDVYEHSHHRGSVISRDAGLAPTQAEPRAGTTRTALILAEAVTVGLERTGAFTSVTLGEACPSEPTAPESGAVLWSRLDYGYGSTLLVSKRWRYAVARWGDRVWMDTIVEQSSTPIFGYGRATMALCTSTGCQPTTVTGYSATETLRAIPGSSTRSLVNIEYGRGISSLAEAMSERSISDATAR
ncbi:MAG: hypothetical protein EP330_12125 [Deltaproteobacteria bacterium]|nr:MAG: hypothetical protein EP330_12125 [Deltaproteobacteria bacterium]